MRCQFSLVIKSNIIFSQGIDVGKKKMRYININCRRERKSDLSFNIFPSKKPQNFLLECQSEKCLVSYLINLSQVG